MKSNVIDFSLFAGAISAIGELEENARTQKKGRVNLAPAIRCGVFLTKLAKNGGFGQLQSSARVRLYNGGALANKTCKSEDALRQMMSKVGADLQKLGNVKPEARLRAKRFCEGVVR